MTRREALAAIGATLLARPAGAGDALPVFPDKQRKWRFFTDQVMGGISTGRAKVDSHLTLQGDVSTKNRGGFIQVRTELPEGLPATARALRLEVSGNDQDYFIHLRTKGTKLPWQYYQAGFAAARQWREILVPLTDFRASGTLLRPGPQPERVTSLALVAFGRDHRADVTVRRIEVV